MRDPREFLPPLPWEGPPVPQFLLSKAPEFIPGEKKGCPACKLYHEIAVADSFFRDISSVCERGSSVPAGYGGTIPRAKEALTKAKAILPEIRTRDGLKALADELEGDLNQLLPSMEWVNGCEEAEAIANQLENTRQKAHTIAREWWRGEFGVEGGTA